LKTFAREFWLFGVKQAWACIFGAYLLALIALTKIYYPEDAWLCRYDFLFLAAVGFQIVLLAFRLETLREAMVIIAFHVVATGMEVFKTSDDIAAWKYPGGFVLGVGNVPLFTGFMYSAVGSYIARVWRIFDFQFSSYPPAWTTWVVVSAIYINFYTCHFTYDIRWALLAITLVLFGSSRIYFRMDQQHRYMPLLVGWGLVALFIWFAENICTYSGIWVYPSQESGWHIVSPSKLIAWYLLMLLSFVLVSLAHQPIVKERSKSQLYGRQGSPTPVLDRKQA